MDREGVQERDEDVVDARDVVGWGIICAASFKVRRPHKKKQVLEEKRREERTDTNRIRRTVCRSLAHANRT